MVGNGECNMRLMVAINVSDQCSTGPRGVAAQSCARMRLGMSVLPMMRLSIVAAELIFLFPKAWKHRTMRSGRRYCERGTPPDAWLFASADYLILGGCVGAE